MWYAKDYKYVLHIVITFRMRSRISSLLCKVILNFVVQIVAVRLLFFVDLFDICKANLGILEVGLGIL